MCLQETKLDGAALAAWERGARESLRFQAGFDAFWAHCAHRRGYCGLVTYVRHGLVQHTRVGFAAAAVDARAAAADGDAAFARAGRVLVSDHGAFVLFNCYFPNTGRMGASIDAKRRFQATLEADVRALLRAGREVVVIGDLNIVPQPIDTWSPQSLERGETSCVLPCERDWLHALLHGPDACLSDAFRVLHPDKRNDYTFWEQRTMKRQQNLGLRIDAALISSGLVPKLRAVEHHHSVMGRCGQCGAVRRCSPRTRQRPLSHYRRL